MLFSSNNSVNFRQKLVVLVGFQICLILIGNTFCANEMADEIIYGIQMDEMADYYEGKERVKNRLAELDLQRCCSGRIAEEEATVDDNKRIVPTRLEFMEPSDIMRANMDKKYQEGKYLLFVDTNNNVFVFDLYLVGYDTEMQQKKIKEFLDEQNKN